MLFSDIPVFFQFQTYNRENLGVPYNKMISKATKSAGTSLKVSTKVCLEYC